jgi:hypothetical protein
VRAEQPADVPPPTLAGIAPEPIDYDFVGELYRAISDGVARLDATLARSGRRLFVGPRELQDGEVWLQRRVILPPLRDVATAQAAITSIIREGEGAPENRQGSHYQRFLNVLAAFRAERAADPGFDPARPVASNPVSREHRDAGAGATLITQPTTRDVAQLFNHLYTTMLLVLMQHFSPAGETSTQRANLRLAARRTMVELIRPLAEVLTQLPVAETGGATAGPGFELYGDLALPGPLPSRWAQLEERLEAEVVEIRRLAALAQPGLARLVYLSRNLELLRDFVRLTAQGG